MSPKPRGATAAGVRGNGSAADRVRDRWAQWLLSTRDAGDPEERRRTLEYLTPVREHVLDNSDLRPGDVLLDVGCGDGLIAFAGLDRVGPGGRVIFADISQDLIHHCRALADELDVLDRCDFVSASADDLPVGNASVDVVTTRSVLIYLDRTGKERAFREFHRVLRPGGRISLAEPINSFGYPQPTGWYNGYDLRAIADLVRKVLEVSSPPEEETLIDFDERDLLAWAESAGFDPLRLEYEAKVEQGSWMHGTWEHVLNSSGNPLVPTLGDAIERALTPEEAARFETHLRPLVEANMGRLRSAFAFLRGVKH
jgi:ubiquinone/menaquinone biosynthesis C-methylase UbiE